MISYWLLAFLCVATTCSYAQSDEDSIPADVKEAFRVNHPGVLDVEWEKDGENYSVTYVEDNLDRESFYTPQGEELETWVDVADEEMPEKVYKHLILNFPQARIEDVDQVERAEDTFYEVEVEDDEADWYLVYDKNGNLISKERQRAEWQE